jgi:hypothetical protein
MAAPTLAEARRAVLRIAVRRASRGTGSDLRHLMARRHEMDWWLAVEAALGGVPHAVIGGVAAQAYMPWRQTDDLEIAVASADLPAAEAALASAGFSRLRPLAVVTGST